MAIKQFSSDNNSDSTDFENNSNYADKRFNVPLNAVERHIHDYVDKPESWNDACTPNWAPEGCMPVRKRDDPKDDEYLCDEVDNYTMQLSPATKFSELSIDAGDNKGRDYWKRLKLRNLDYKPRETEDIRGKRMDENYRWVGIEWMADNLGLSGRHRVALHNVTEQIDMEKSGRPLQVMYFVSAVWIIKNDPRYELNDDEVPWHPDMDMEDRHEDFVRVRENISDQFVNYQRFAIQNAYTAVDEILTEGDRSLYTGTVPTNPLNRKQYDKKHETGFEDEQVKHYSMDPDNPNEPYEYSRDDDWNPKRPTLEC